MHEDVIALAIPFALGADNQSDTRRGNDATYVDRPRVFRLHVHTGPGRRLQPEILHLHENLAGRERRYGAFDEGEIRRHRHSVRSPHQHNLLIDHCARPLMGSPVVMPASIASGGRPMIASDAFSAIIIVAA
jgi:hypothetical protein